MFLKSKLSEVIRAEAETCFLEIMKINILMLLLFVMIINNLVLTKVAIIQNIMIRRSFYLRISQHRLIVIDLVTVNFV